MAMQRKGQNDYERAFEGLLREEGVRFKRVDQTHRCVVGHGEVKTFDYLIYPRQGGCVLVELKGRIFEGDTLAGRRRLENWALAEDAAALARWQERFMAETPETEAVFVFAYRINKIAADADGLAVYDDNGRRYVFLAIRLQDYRRCMKRRSPRWKTVSLSADDFRRHSFCAERIWLGLQNIDEYDHTNGGRDDSGRRTVIGAAGQRPVGGVV